MTEYLVKPLVGFENVTFGEQRESVREKLVGYDYNVLKINEFTNTVDDYGDFLACYTSEDTLEAIELLEGSAFINGKSFSIDDPITDVEIPGIHITAEEGKIAAILIHCSEYFSK